MAADLSADDAPLISASAARRLGANRPAIQALTGSLTQAINQRRPAAGGGRRGRVRGAGRRPGAGLNAPGDGQVTRRTEQFPRGAYRAGPRRLAARRPGDGDPPRAVAGALARPRIFASCATPSPVALGGAAAAGSGGAARLGARAGWDAARLARAAQVSPGRRAAGGDRGAVHVHRGRGRHRRRAVSVAFRGAKGDTRPSFARAPLCLPAASPRQPADSAGAEAPGVPMQRGRKTHPGVRAGRRSIQRTRVIVMRKTWLAVLLVMLSCGTAGRPALGRRLALGRHLGGRPRPPRPRPAPAT